MSFWQILFSFQWRLNRAKFFWNLIILWLIQIAMLLVLWMVIWLVFPGYMDVATSVGSLLFVYPILALTTKRFHDMNKNGKWFMPIYIIYMLLIPIISFYPEVMIINYISYALMFIVAITWLILIFKQWTVWENKYGEDLVIRTEENNENNKKGKRVLWRVLALSIPIIGMIRLIVSLVFWLLWASTDPTMMVEWWSLLLVIKSFLNRILWILWLLSIPGTIIGIILLTKNKKTV